MFGLSIDAVGPNFGTESLLDVIADAADLASLVGEQTRLLWPADYGLSGLGQPERGAARLDRAQDRGWAAPVAGTRLAGRQRGHDPFPWRGGAGCEYATTLELTTENSNMNPSPLEPERGGRGCPLNRSQTP